MTKRFGLSKAERLKSRKEIDALFEKRQRFSVYPLQVWYGIETITGEKEVRMGVSCSKRLFKRAVDRNRVKRIIREAYRLQKNILIDALANDQRLQVFFVYLDQELPVYTTMMDIMNKCLQTLKKKAAHEAIG